tara:strand:- start:341 stop:1984 length:1644 start_codon:yes stop_codon:yes gene_type:complete
MALSINLNSTVNIDANHVVSVSAGSGVTANTTATSYISNTNYVLTPNSGIQVTIATITFTASSDYYYFKQPRYKIKTTNSSVYSITETITRDSNDRITSKVFVIKYTNTENSLGNMILFDHTTKALPATKNIHNNTLVELKSFVIDSSDIASSGGNRSFNIKGGATARFNLKVTRSSDSKTYDFTSYSFTSTATELSNQLVGGTGLFTGSIGFPNVSADDVYTIELSPVFSKGTTLNSNIQDSTNKLTYTTTINQYKAITITVSLASTSYSGSYNTLPSDITFVGERNSTIKLQKNVSWDLSLSANSFTFTRGYTTNVASMAELDFRSSTIKVKNGNQSAGTVVVFDDVDGLVEGMTMTGTGVTGSPRVLSVNSSNKTVTVTVTQNAQGDGGMADDANITFAYGGSSTSKAINGCEFQLIGIDEITTGYLLNAATLTPVETLVNGDFTGVSASATITLDSTAGIKAGSTTTVAGKGINAAASVPYVNSVTNSTVLVFSASQVLDDNTPLTFTGSSRSANLAFDLAITNFGTANHTLTVNLDSILTVS